MIGSQKKEGIMDTASKIATLQFKSSRLEETLKELLNLEKADKEQLSEYENLLSDAKYDGIMLFYILRRRRELESQN